MTASARAWFEMKATAPKRAEISIYDQIGQDFWTGEGMTAKKFANQLKDLGELEHIDLRINSPGGSMFDGNTIYNLLDQHSATIHVYIDGLAASMASVIAMVGDKIVMPQNALMMIHNPSTVAVGDANKLQKTIELLNKLKVGATNAYTRKTGLEEKTVAKMMDEETWMTAEEAYTLGFCDEVDEPVQVAAQFNPDGVMAAFSNTPKSLLPKAKEEEDPPVMAVEPAKVPEINQEAIDAAVAMALEAQAKKMQDEANANAAEAIKAEKIKNLTNRFEQMSADGKLAPAQAKNFIEMAAGVVDDEDAQTRLIELAESMNPHGLLNEQLVNNDSGEEAKGKVEETVKAEDFKFSNADIPENTIPESAVIHSFATNVLQKENPSLSYKDAVMQAEKHPKVKEIISGLGR